jgi:NADP oxidoreductase coenzyme F420-dependent
MKLAIIGSGRMGSAFATAFATRTSHAVAVRGSHAKSGSAAELVRELGITRADDKALLSADVVLVAVPQAALSEVAADLKDYTGVVDHRARCGRHDARAPRRKRGRAARRAAAEGKRGHGVHLDFFRADPHAETRATSRPFLPVPTTRTRGRPSSALQRISDSRASMRACWLRPAASSISA